MNVKVSSLISIITGLTIASLSAAPQIDPITEVLLTRHSGYAFDTSRPVTRIQIQAIMKAGQSAPSSYNDQPWYFIIADRTTNPRAYNKVFNTLAEFNQEWVKNVPVLIICIASTNSARDNGFNRFAQYDTGAAALAMVLQATSFGLMAHQMGGFDPEKIKKTFGISDDFVPMAVMAIGYPAANEPKAPKKERKPLSQNFFMGTWNIKSR